MKLKKPNLKSFKTFLQENLYLVTDGSTSKAFMVKNDALEYQQENKKRILKSVTLVELKEIYTEEEYKEFVSNNAFLK